MPVAARPRVGLLHCDDVKKRRQFAMPVKLGYYAVSVSIATALVLSRTYQIATIPVPTTFRMQRRKSSPYRMEF